MLKKNHYRISGLKLALSVLAGLAGFMSYPVAAKEVAGIELEYDTNRRGADYDQFRTKNAGQCARECARDDRCRAFAYNRSEGECRLKDREQSPRYQERIVSGAKRRSHGGGSGSGGVSGMSLDYDTNRLGGDYDDFRAGDVQQCASTCSRDRRCRAFAYSERNGRCWLKERASNPTPQRGIVSGAKRGGGGGNGSGHKPPPREIAGIKIYDNQKRSGYDYRNFNSGTVQRCAHTCADDRRCRAFNFGKERGDCHLKNDVPRGENNRTVISGVKKGSGSYEWPREIAGITINYDLKRSGNDYKNFNAGSLERCARACANERKCDAFNYGKDRGDCHLKDGVPKGQRNTSVISGIKKGR